MAQRGRPRSQPTPPLPRRYKPWIDFQRLGEFTGHLAVAIRAHPTWTIEDELDYAFTLAERYWQIRTEDDP